MKLRIITSAQTTDHLVSWVDIHTPTGNAIILEDHIPMVAILTSNKKLTFKLKTGEVESVSIIKDSIIEIQRKEITILL
jgi:F0F1-type ATP synthase epsilon subunit